MGAVGGRRGGGGGTGGGGGDGVVGFGGGDGVGGVGGSHGDAKEAWRLFNWAFLLTAKQDTVKTGNRILDTLWEALSR
jgi:hypothetical protein